MDAPKGLVVDIPGRGVISIEHVVFDFNGTLAAAGSIPPSVKQKVKQLKEILNVHVLTADTFGTAHSECEDLGVTASVVKGVGGKAKLKYVEGLGLSNTIAVGNGDNDEAMLRACALGIAVIGVEGCSTRALMASDLVVYDVGDCIELILYPKRLIATLRK